jgi:hypothetical protein
MRLLPPFPGWPWNRASTIIDKQSIETLANRVGYSHWIIHSRKRDAEISGAVGTDEDD